MKHIIEVIVLENNIHVIKEIILQSKYGKNRYFGTEIGIRTALWVRNEFQFVVEVSFQHGALYYGINLNMYENKIVVGNKMNDGMEARASLHL